MLPSSICSLSAPNSYTSLLRTHRNAPEEDDETMSSAGREAGVVPEIDSASNLHPRLFHHSALSEDSVFGQWSIGQEDPHSLSCCSYQPLHSLPIEYNQPTPFPSRVSWLHSSLDSSWTDYPSSLPSCLSHKPYPDGSAESCPSRCKSSSLPSQHSNTSLEQPMSLRSNQSSAKLYHHTLSPYSDPPPGPACFARCPMEASSRRPMVNKQLWSQYNPLYGPYHPGDCRLPGVGFTQLGPDIPVKEIHPAYSTPLSLEQRRLFVTYEADNDKHVNEIINFVALLRHNGFDTHIDIFEQQFKSISKIDFMERYLSEKEYLIIIIISPKYYETVTASPFDLEHDERTFNTVYIHKQLQNEFIQNGSKNFRFIPILFPGAKKCHVPNWLQNTHVYAWPRDRDDILRRLMRVEKYNPPPIGELPTIVSIPI